MDILTIGFTRTTAERFFGRLTEARVERVLDIRLRNTSQLAGFARAQDLPFFLRALCGATYAHEPRLAPDAPLLDRLRREHLPWAAYERAFLSLMQERDVPASLRREDFAPRTALLCAEPGPEHCHRRLVAELLARQWGARVTHL